MKYKNQHYIPVTYLQAWCDPESPKGYTPYIWLFSKDGTDIRKKAPEKILHANNLYTTYTENGQRDLTLEHNLSKIETEFARLRKNKISKRKSLSPEEHFILCMFVAAMYGRTKSYGEHWGRQWKQVLDLGEKLLQYAENASPEELKQLAAASALDNFNEENDLTIEDVRKIVESPIQSTLSATVSILAPELYKLPYMILETSEQVGFITSDAPCVWFDPAIRQNPRPVGAGGLMSPTLEISLPLSPTQTIFFGKHLIATGAYVPIKEQYITDNLNKRTRIHSHEYFIVNSPILKLGWFR